MSNHEAAEETSAAPRRVIGRILSLGFPLPGPRVDNYNVATAPAFFDYDALVVDPAACGRFIEDVLRGQADAATFAGARVRPSSGLLDGHPGDVAVGDLIASRRDEAARLLAHGGVIVCFLHPESHHVTGEDGARIGDYDWLPDAVRESLTGGLVRCEGSQVHVVDFTHPLASFVAGQAANLTYRASIDERPLNARVFARSQGGAAVGVEMPLDEGRLVLLPALRALPSGEARYVMSDALQAGIRHALGAIAEGHAPSWLKQHPLPGLAERDAERAAAQADLDAARTAVARADAARDEIARFQRLLWQEGEHGIEDVVIDALKLIGCEVYATNRDEFEMTIDRESVLFEVEASEHPVGLEAHHRLRQRIERAIERRGVAPRGVLFVNGERLSDPATRKAEVTPQLALAAETMRYCIAPTSSLYAAVAAQMSGDMEAVTAYQRVLRETNGVLATT